MSTNEHHCSVRQQTTACLLAIAAALAAGCGNSDDVDKVGNRPSTKPIELVVAHHDSGSEHIQPWADAVERRSGGSMRLRISNGWRAGESAFERDTLADVRSGKVAVATIAARAFDEAGVTSFQPLVAPMLIDSRELERRVLRGDVGSAALAGTRKLGLLGLALYPTELRRPFGISRTLAGPADFRDARVYAREGRIGEQALEALGARVIRKPIDEWFSSVDGAEVGLSGARNQPAVARRAAGFTANVVLWPQPLAVVINQQTFEKLSDAQQQAMLGAGADAFAAESRVVAEIDDEDRGVLCRIGAKVVRATPAQLAGFRAALAPVYRTIGRSARNRQALTRIRELKSDTPPETLTCPSATTTTSDSRPPAARELEGTYRANFSEQALRDSPLLMDAGEVNDENWGRFELRLADGRVRMTQRNAKASFAIAGRYTTKGDVLEWDLDEIGETWTFRWSLYRGVLKLQREAKLGIAPTPMVLKPWRRIR